MSRIRIPRRKKSRMGEYERAAVAASFALSAVLLWRSMQNPPKVYPGGRRMHHGLLGAVLVVLGVALKRSDVVAFGLILALDDIEDLPHWFDFERCSPQSIECV